jgi:hypothetical protein
MQTLGFACGKSVVHSGKSLCAPTVSHALTGLIFRADHARRNNTMQSLPSASVSTDCTRIICLNSLNPSPLESAVGDGPG